MKNNIPFFSAVLALWMTLSAPAQAEFIVLAVPGPGSLTYLPVYLAKALAADEAEGLQVKLTYFGGGPLALRDMNDRNAEFAVVGLPAIASARADGMPILAIGQLSQAAMYVFMLRADLKYQVRTLAQLKGRRIGAGSSTSKSRSMGAMMTGYLLERAGLKSGDVQLISSGQSREATRAALSSNTVDAFLGDEPFASELAAEGLAVKLADLYPPEKSKALLGGPIVHAALATREDVYAQHPATVKKVQRMFDRTLLWMAQHSAQEIIAKLGGQPGFEAAQGRLLIEILQRSQGMFPDHVAWDAQAVATTERFFHSMATDPQESNLPFADFVRPISLE